MATAPVVKRRRDWFAILRTLARHGVSMADVAAACDRSPSSVKAWQYLSEPKESDARIVLALLAKHAPDEYAKQQAEFGVRFEIEARVAAGILARRGWMRRAERKEADDERGWRQMPLPWFLIGSA